MAIQRLEAGARRAGHQSAPVWRNDAKPKPRERIAYLIQAATRLLFGLSEGDFPAREPHSDETVQGAHNRGRRSAHASGDLRDAVSAGPDGIEDRANLDRRGRFLDEQKIIMRKRIMRPGIIFESEAGIAE
jgi:hypothetical protein